MNNKNEIRADIRRKRLALSPEEMIRYSGAIFDKLKNLPEYEQNNKIFTYVSCKNEVDTILFINYCLSDLKQVFVPKVCGDTMEFYEISDISELHAGRFGIYEPDIIGIDPDYSRKGLFIMPGIAFDEKGNRIGQGGGFYDRYLSLPHRFDLVALAYDFQILAEIEPEDHDIKPHKIITPTKIINI